jgi:DNA-directed RNA polymerase specialized sigma24 family protein
VASKIEADMNQRGQSRVERLLAYLLLEQMERAPQTRKVQVLSFAGFTNAEIAEMLQTTAAVVAQRLYEARGASGQPRRARVRRTAGAPRK